MIRKPTMEDLDELVDACRENCYAAEIDKRFYKFNAGNTRTALIEIIKNPSFMFLVNTHSEGHINGIICFVLQRVNLFSDPETWARELMWWGRTGRVAMKLFFAMHDLLSKDPEINIISIGLPSSAKAEEIIIKYGFTKTEICYGRRIR